MKREFLTDLGLEKTVIDKIMSENGNDIEREKSKLDIASRENAGLKSQVETLTAEKTELEGLSGDVEAYKNKLAEFEQKELEKTEAERKVREDSILTNAVLAAIGGKKFVNDYTESGILNEVKTKLAAGEKDIAKVFEELTKDKDGIFKNPNTTIIPPVGDTTPTQDDIMRAAMGLPTDKNKE
ncbi:MAG: phage scaffolding protein [Oscillospiraceae bacterium]